MGLVSFRTEVLLRHTNPYVGFLFGRWLGLNNNMPRYFSKIENGIVATVIVADSLEWCVEHLGGEWIETFMDEPGRNYAGKGYSHDGVRDNFIAPQPFKSWKLNKDDHWESPVPRPVETTVTTREKLQWDEIKQDWGEKSLIFLL